MSSLQKIESLRRLPWYSIELPSQVTQGLGMIHQDERRMLYTLAKDYYSGEGRIIDGGTFLGTSSLSLGFGLNDSGKDCGAVIDAYDNFIVDEYSAKAYLSHRKDIQAWQNIRSVYEGYVAPVAKYITIHEGDLLQDPWKSGPIEIVFSDISKSWELNDFIIQNWIKALIPEKGILIQQDQIQEYHVWVGITMEILADYFEFIDYTTFSSMVFRLKHEIPQRVLDKCMRANLSNAELEYYYLNFLDRFRRIGMGRYTGWQLGMVEVGNVVNFSSMGENEKAERAAYEVKKKFGHIADTMARLNQVWSLPS